ncbi:MAG: ATP-binding protein [Gemmatimonadota bacterium]
MVSHRLAAPWRLASSRRFLLASALFCVVYVLTDVAVGLYDAASFPSAPWRPQAALAVALIARGGIAYAPALFVAVFVAEALGAAAAFGPIGYGVACLGIAAVYCSAGWLIGRLTRWGSPDASLRDLTLLIAVALGVGIVVPAVLESALLVSSTQPLVRTFDLFREVAIGHVLGLIVLLPILLQWPAGAWRAWTASPETLRAFMRDLVLFVLAVIGVLAVVFVVRPFNENRMFYLMFLPMILAAMRYGLTGTALALPIVQIALIAAVSAFTVNELSALQFQLLMVALSVTSLYLGAAVSERERATERWAQTERELREEREALSEAQRTAQIGELTVAVAHDLNQPLSAIGTYARACHLMVERGEADRAALLKTLDQLAAESARAGQYVRRMREFFRFGAMRSERVDLARLVEAAHAHLRDRLDREGIVWRAVIEPGLPAVRGDPVQIGMILDNLLVNACDAMHGTSVPRIVEVTAQRERGTEHPTVRVSVEDTGNGVPDEVREQLFKPLSTSKPHGMGLGLSLSRSIAERLGGRLWFDAGRRRTTFCLDLPIDE